MVNRAWLFPLVALFCWGSGSLFAVPQERVLDRLEQWPHWRGPLGTGVSPTAQPPLRWDERTNIRWKVAVPGYGTSSPIVWGDQVYVLTAVDTGVVDPDLPPPEEQPDRIFGIKYPNTYYEFVVISLDRETGGERWRHVANRLVPHEGHHGDASFASASPITDGERLYCWFGSAGLFCYNLDGELLWSRDLGKVNMPASLGEGTSPAVFDGRVVIVRDHIGQSTIDVIDAATGDTLWRRERDEPATWATPVIVRYGGRTQVITAASNFVRSYDLYTGELIWQCSGLTGNVIPTPVVHDGVVYCMSGYKGYALLALPLSARGDISGSDAIVWSRHEATPYIPSPLLYDGLLYYLQSNQGILSCVEAKTGETVLPRTRLNGLLNIYSSPVGALGRVYITSRNGTTLVIEKAREYKELARNRLEDRIDSSAALAGDSIFLRGRKFLYRIAETQ